MLPIVDGTIDHLLLCAMAQIGAATTDEIVTEIHSYTDGKDVSREEVESTHLNALVRPRLFLSPT